MKITPLTSNALMPTTNDFGGITIMSSRGIELTPGETCQIPTDLALKCPTGTYARVGNVPNNPSLSHLGILNDLIGNECRNLSITMCNQSLGNIKIHKHQPVATVLLEKSEPLMMESTTRMHGLKSILKKKTTHAKAATLSEHQMDAIVLSENPYDNEIDVKIPNVTRR